MTNDKLLAAQEKSVPARNNSDLDGGIASSDATQRTYEFPMRGLSGLTVVGMCVALAACGGDTGKVKFSSKKYGVAASPRVVSSTSSSVPKGGGRRVTGKPYKVAGKWYYPKLEKNYKKTGLASWYGPTFHGRKTANGEIFDRNALTAAHPTMPLPSYARVTNVKNGRSMVVRVNDRGPFHGNRVIDLSERVANKLGTHNSGVAKVKVEYMGPAPLHGRDEQYLLASYRGSGGVAPGGTRPGTLLAFNSPNQVPVINPPVPRRRPYALSVPTLLASNGAVGLGETQLDPALVFERPAQGVQVASITSFREQIGQVIQRPAVTQPTPQPVQQISYPSYPPRGGLLPPNSQGFGQQQRQPTYIWQQPRVNPGSAVSSFAAEPRVSAAYKALKSHSGGSGLRALLLATAKREN